MFVQLKIKHLWCYSGCIPEIITCMLKQISQIYFVSKDSSKVDKHIQIT